LGGNGRAAGCKSQQQDRKVYLFHNTPMDNLGLSEGKQAFAVINASNVMFVFD
jgi:hypothetical protein